MEKLQAVHLVSFIYHPFWKFPSCLCQLSDKYNHNKIHYSLRQTSNSRLLHNNDQELSVIVMSPVLLQVVSIFGGVLSTFTQTDFTQQQLKSQSVAPLLDHKT